MFPPRLTDGIFFKLGQFTSMDTNSLLSELFSVCYDHFHPSLLLNRSLSHGGGIIVHEHSQGDFFTIVHPRVTVLTFIVNCAFKLVQIAKVFKSSLILHVRHGCKSGVLNVG